MKLDLLPRRRYYTGRSKLKAGHNKNLFSSVTYTKAGVSQRPYDPKGHSKNRPLTAVIFFLSHEKKAVSRKAEISMELHVPLLLAIGINNTFGYAICIDRVSPFHRTMELENS